MINFSDFIGNYRYRHYKQMGDFQIFAIGHVITCMTAHNFILPTYRVGS